MEFLSSAKVTLFTKKNIKGGDVRESFAGPLENHNSRTKEAA